MKKITCLIVDDEPNAIGLLASYLEKVPYMELRHSCYDAVEALAYLREHPVDVVFLDIEMHEMNGMELSTLLKRDMKIIFTTAYSQYAVESYERNAVDYLLKPITFKRFMQAIVKLTEKTSMSEVTNSADVITDEATFFKTGRAMIKVNYASILFFEAQKEYAAVITEREKILIYKRMKDLEKDLPATFQRIHHSFIVNLRHIKKIEDNHVWIGTRKLSMSEKYRNDFLKKLKTF